MYHMKQKKIFFVGITLVFFALSLLYFLKIEESQIETGIAQKVESLEDDIFRLSLWKPSINTETEVDVEIEWWYQDINETYYLFVPEAISRELCYMFNLYDSIVINDREIMPGDEFDLSEGSYEIKLDSGETVLLEVMLSRNINAMFLQTDLGDLTGIHESKQYYDTGSYILMDSHGDVNCSGRVDRIRTRGNVTFDGTDKKSYNIRMESKTAVLDLGTAKSWSLLANAFDDSLARNQLVTELAKGMDMAYVPDMDYVDLYINGEYKGNYQLAEKVEISRERLNIRNLEEEMKLLNPDWEYACISSREEDIDGLYEIKWVEDIVVPEDITSGYLLELDMEYRYDMEQSGFITARKQPVVIKSPECVNYEQVYYVANKYQDMEDALCSENGYNELTGMYLDEYLDFPSFAQKYLVEEICKNLDAALTSFYLYIPENSAKFHAGPIWDYDRSWGVGFERGGVDLMDPSTFYVAENIDFEEADINFFYLLCQQEDFRKLYQQMYFDEVRDSLVKISEQTAREIEARIESSAMMDAIRNDSLVDETDVEANREAYHICHEVMQQFITKRIEFLDEAWR